MTSHDACTSGTSRVLTVASLQRLKIEAPTAVPTDCEREVQSMITFLNAQHNPDRHLSSAVPGLRPHTARWRTYLLQEFGWEVFNHHPLYSPDLAPSDFHIFLHLKKFLFGQRQRFQNDRWRWVSQWFQTQAAEFHDTGYKSWSHCMTYAWIPELITLKSSWTLAVSVPINLSLNCKGPQRNLLCGLVTYMSIHFYI